MFRRSAGSSRHSTVVAYLALFVALGGTAAYAADKIDGGDVAKRSVPGNRLEKGGVGTKEAKDLLAKDFKSGELPAGAQGPQGLQGPPGPSSGPAGGDLTGSYPDPTIGAGRITADKIGTLPAVAVSHGFIQEADGQALSFDTELFDASQMHNDAGDTTRLVAPIDGIYQVAATATFLTDGGGGNRTLIIRKNGANAVAVGLVPGSSVTNITTETSALVKLAANDFVQVTANETSVNEVDVFTCSPGTECPYFSMHWVAPR